jgi:hypothetical protein
VDNVRLMQISFLDIFMTQAVLILSRKSNIIWSLSRNMHFSHFEVRWPAQRLPLVLSLCAFIFVVIGSPEFQEQSGD